jgi:hypothetical protein
VTRAAVAPAVGRAVRVPVVRAANPAKLLVVPAVPTIGAARVAVAAAVAADRVAPVARGAGLAVPGPKVPAVLGRTR